MNEMVSLKIYPTIHCNLLITKLCNNGQWSTIIINPLSAGFFLQDSEKLNTALLLPFELHG